MKFKKILLNEKNEFIFKKKFFFFASSVKIVIINIILK